MTAIDAFDAGDACTIFTPDDTHFAIALAAVQRGLHTMVTKPVVKTLDEHRQLYEAAKKAGVLVMVEVCTFDAFALRCAIELNSQWTRYTT